MNFKSDATESDSSLDENEELQEGEVAAERQSFLESEARRRQVVPRAALLGVFVGLLAVTFRMALESVDRARTLEFAHWQTLGWLGFVLCVLWSALGAGAGVYLVKKFAPEAGGSGVPHLKGVLLGLNTLRPVRIIVVKFLGGLLALGSGLVMGREGPTLQMGGSLGALAARFLGSDTRSRQILIAAGAAAGLSAAFNAPLAGLIFVLEEVQRDFDPAMFAAAMMASLVADVIGRLISGSAPAFSVEIAPTSLVALIAYAVLGIGCGLAGVAFNRALMWGSNQEARWQKLPIPVLGLVIGAIIGGIGFFAPQFLSAGHGMTEALFSLGESPSLVAAAKHLLWLIPLLFALRFAMTIGSYSTGAAGGFFAPILALGAQLGLFVAVSTQLVAPGLLIHPQNFAVVGMAALFAASVRAPLTSIVLIIEMTNGYTLILPLLTACLCAYGTADALNDLPIYEALLERDLERQLHQEKVLAL